MFVYEGITGYCVPAVSLSFTLEPPRAFVDAHTNPLVMLLPTDAAKQRGQKQTFTYFPFP